LPQRSQITKGEIVTSQTLLNNMPQSNSAAGHLPAFCLLILSLLTLPTGAQAEDRSAHCRYVNLATVPVNFIYGLATVEANFNGSSSTMLVDTGMGITTITIQEAINHNVLTGEKALEIRKQMADAHPELFGKDGKSAMFVHLINDITMGNMHSSVPAFVLFNSKNSGSFEAQMGGNILFSKDIEISLQEQKIRFFEPKGCSDDFLAYWDDHASFTKLRKMSSRDGRAIVGVQVNGKNMRAVIDSAAPYSHITEQAAARLGITPLTAGVKDFAAETITHGHPVKTWIAPFDNFTIGEETIDHPKMVVMDSQVDDADTLTAQSNALDRATDIVLGIDFLLSHRVLFSIDQQRMYFSYLGGKVFYDGIAPPVAKVAQPN
jgi:predicted aspartyl protease